MNGTKAEWIQCKWLKQIAVGEKVKHNEIPALIDWESLDETDLTVRIIETKTGAISKVPVAQIEVIDERFREKS